MCLVAALLAELEHGDSGFPSLPKACCFKPFEILLQAWQNILPTTHQLGRQNKGSTKHPKDQRSIQHPGFFFGCLPSVAALLQDLILGLDGFDLLDVAPLDLSAAFFIGFSIILARINNQAICTNLYRERAGSAFAMLATLRGLASIGGMLLMPAISGSWSREIVAASLGWLFVSSIAAAFHSPLFKVAEVAGEKEEPSAEETEGV